MRLEELLIRHEEFVNKWAEWLDLTEYQIMWIAYAKGLGTGIFLWIIL